MDCTLSFIMSSSLLFTFICKPLGAGGSMADWVSRAYNMLDSNCLNGNLICLQGRVH